MLPVIHGIMGLFHMVLFKASSFSGYGHLLALDLSVSDQNEEYKLEEFREAEDPNFA